MSEPKQNARKYSILEIVGAIVALSGFLAALAWYLGKSFNQGYYAAFGVSDDIVNISNYEITSKGAIPLVLFLLTAAAITVSAITILSDNTLFSRPINYIEKHLFKSLNSRRQTSVSYYVVMMPLVAVAIVSVLYLPKDLTGSRPPIAFFIIVAMFLLVIQLEGNRMCAVSSTPELTRKTWIAFRPAYMILPILIWYFWLVLWTSSMGYDAGCEDTVNSANIYTIYSTNPLPLENGNNNVTQNNIFEYSSYYGFTGNEYLVLYNKLDTISNRPIKIYFIRKSGVFGFSITRSNPSKIDVRNIITKCQKIIESRISDYIDYRNFQLFNK